MRDQKFYDGYNLTCAELTLGRNLAYSGESPKISLLHKKKLFRNLSATDDIHSREMI
jgi:hypothetical protein